MPSQQLSLTLMTVLAFSGSVEASRVETDTSTTCFRVKRGIFSFDMKSSYWKAGKAAECFHGRANLSDLRCVRTRFGASEGIKKYKFPGIGNVALDLERAHDCSKQEVQGECKVFDQVFAKHLSRWSLIVDGQSVVDDYENLDKSCGELGSNDGFPSELAHATLGNLKRFASIAECQEDLRCEWDCAQGCLDKASGTY